MAETHQDKDLWQRASAGNAAARNEVLQHVQIHARARLFGRVPANDLDDLVQRVAVSVLAFMDRGGMIKDLTVFSKYRAIGVLSGYRKEKRTLRSQSTTELEHDHHAHLPSPRKNLLRSELVAAFHQCRTGLAEQLKTAFDMRWIDGIETPLMAKRLGVTANAVHLRLFKARRAIRECLEIKGFDEGDLS